MSELQVGPGSSLQPFILLPAACRLQLSSSLPLLSLLSSCPCCRKIKKKKKRRNLTSRAVPSRCLIPSVPPPPPLCSPALPLHDLLKQHTLACLSKPQNRCSSKDLTPPLLLQCACAWRHIRVHTRTHAHAHTCRVRSEALLLCALLPPPSSRSGL